MTLATSRDAATSPLDLSHHWSKVSKTRQASAIKSFYKFFQIPNIGNLGGGSYFSSSLCWSF
jgi:site-specific recombinase XerD